MAPPKYADLTKQASDIFNKGYCMFKISISLLLIYICLVFNLFKLDIKTQTANKVNFNVVGEHNTETTKTLGSLETKYVVPEYGLTFLEKWNTDNLLKVEITADDQLAQGFKLVFDGSLVPNTGYKIQFRILKKYVFFHFEEKKPLIFVQLMYMIKLK